MLVLFEAALSRFSNKGQGSGIARANAALSMSLVILINFISIAELLYLLGWVDQLFEGTVSRAAAFSLAGMIALISFALTHRAQTRISVKGERDSRFLRNLLIGYVVGSVLALLVLSMIVAARVGVA